MQHSEQTISDCYLKSSGKNNSSVLDIFNYTRTSGGEQVLQRMLVTRMESVEEILAMQETIQFTRNHIRELDFEIINAELHYINQYFRINSNKTAGVGIITRLKYQYTNDPDFAYLRSNVSRIVFFLQEIRTKLPPNTDGYPQLLKKSIDRLLEIFSDPDYELHIAASSGTQQISKILQTDNFLRKQFRVLFHEIMDHLYQVEAIVSIAKACDKHSLSFPVFCTGNEFMIRDAFHLLIRNAVKIDFRMEAGKNLLFLSGANMAGKSSFLRSVGTILCLAHAGFPVPASGAVLPFYDEISINISVQDNPGKGYSHFYNEILGVNNFLQNLAAGKKCFAIFDEIFKSTNLNDAIHCAAILLDAIKPYEHSVAMISSHNMQLAGEATENMQFNYFESGIENGQPVFNYKLQPGKNEMALGLFLFQQMRSRPGIKR